MDTTQVKQTPLFNAHRALGAKMVPFAGFHMPLSYQGQLSEHKAVREKVGLFDLSHMGELRLRGSNALRAADELVTNRILGTDPGQVIYSPMCRPDGGIVDDLLVYHLEDSVLLVVNASNIEKDIAWIREQLPPGVTMEDESDATALIAVQGPQAEGFVSRLTNEDLSGLDYYRSVAAEVAGFEMLLSRTGYTGEDGFELYAHASQAEAVWQACMDLEGMEPIGLAARDTLRFEVGYCLYGNDLDDTTTPLEAGLGWTVKQKKDSFIGKETLAAQKRDGVKRKLVGLEPEDRRAIPRQGYRIVDGDRSIGEVTSGTFSPTLGRGLAMGYVETSKAEPGATVDVEIRKKQVRAQVVRPSFYTQGSRKTGK